MRDFRQLNVWNEAHSLCLEIYGITKSFPKEELFGLTSQIRRAAVSVSSNIAEGCGRGTNKEYAQFLQVAIGSAYEVDNQLLLAKDLGYLPTENYKVLNVRVDRTKRQLAALLKKVREACN